MKSYEMLLATEMIHYAHDKLILWKFGDLKMATVIRLCNNMMIYFQKGNSASSLWDKTATQFKLWYVSLKTSVNRWSSLQQSEYIVQ